MGNDDITGLSFDPEESEPQNFAAAIGWAIVTWQQVEMQQANLFAHLLASRAGLAASAVFYTVKNHSTRLELMKVAAKWLFMMKGPRKRKVLEGEWGSLLARMKEASNLRNRIAHFELDEEMTATGWRLKLRRSRSDFSHIDPNNRERAMAREASRVLKYSHIKDAATEFAELASDLGRFAQAVFRSNQPRLANRIVQEPSPVQASSSIHRHRTATRPQSPLGPKRRKPR